jgi:hypothetical protein
MYLQNFSRTGIKPVLRNCLFVSALLYGCYSPQPSTETPAPEASETTHPSLAFVTFVPTQRYPDLQDKDFRITSLGGGVQISGGVPVLSLYATVRPGDLSPFNNVNTQDYGKRVFADIEIKGNGRRVIRTVDFARRHSLSRRQVIDTDEEDYFRPSAYEIQINYSLGALFLPEGEQELEISVKLYTYRPQPPQNGRSQPNLFAIEEMDRVPFAIKNKKIKVFVPPMEYFRVRLEELRLRGREKHDNFVPFLGSGEADLVYFFHLGGFPLYASEEYHNRHSIPAPSDWICLGMQPADSLFLSVGDDDDGIFGIGDRVEWIGLHTFSLRDLHDQNTISGEDSTLILRMTVHPFNR